MSWSYCICSVGTILSMLILYCGAWVMRWSGCGLFVQFTCFEHMKSTSRWILHSEVLWIWKVMSVWLTDTDEQWVGNVQTLSYRNLQSGFTLAFQKLMYDVTFGWDSWTLCAIFCVNPLQKPVRMDETRRWSAGALLNVPMTTQKDGRWKSWLGWDKRLYI